MATPPNVGERRTKDGVTAEWDGQAWMRVEDETLEPEVSATRATPEAPAKSVSGFAGNVLRNIPEAAMSVYGGMKALGEIPINPVSAVPRLVKGLASAATDAATGLKQRVSTQGVGGAVKSLASDLGEYAYTRPVEAALDVSAVIPASATVTSAGKLAQRAAKLGTRAENLYMRGLGTSKSLLKKNVSLSKGDPGEAERIIARRGLQEQAPITDTGEDLVEAAIRREDDAIGNALSGSTATMQAPDFLRGGELQAHLKNRASLTAVDPRHERLAAAKEVARNFIEDPAVSRTVRLQARPPQGAMIPPGMTPPTPPPDRVVRLFRDMPVQQAQRYKVDLGQKRVAREAGREIPSPYGEAESSLRRDLARGIAAREPAVSAPNRALSELYPLEQAIKDAIERGRHGSVGSWGGAVGRALWTPFRSLPAQLLGAGLGASVRSPSVLSHAALKLDRYAQRLPELAMRRALTRQVGSGASLLDQAVLDDLQTSTERP